MDNLLISQPDSAEQALDITEKLVSSGAVDSVVIDSVAALVPQAEIEGDMGDVHVGMQARLMSQALRKLTSTINRSRTAVVFINQIREKIGVTYGSPEVTPGGRALKFYSSVRIDLGDLLDIGVNQGFIKKAGSFYSYGETRLGQGRENSKNFLSEHPEISGTIEALIRGEDDPDGIDPDGIGNGYGLSAANGDTPHVASADRVSLN